MTPERWQEIERLYHAVLNRPAPERASFLASACDGDADLRREVESLLAHSDFQSGRLHDRSAGQGRAARESH